MSDELLEEVRLLANMDTDSEKLLPIVLVGESEFGGRLEPAARLWPLKQRVTIRTHLRPLPCTKRRSTWRSAFRWRAATHRSFSPARPSSL